MKTVLSRLLSATLICLSAISTLNAAPTPTTFTLDAGVTGVTTGTLGNVQPVVAGVSDLSGGSSTTAYVAQTFTPSVSGLYNFGMTSASYDSAMIIYEGSFNASSPAANAIEVNDDGFVSVPSGVTITGCGGSVGLCPRLEINLTAGTQYTVLIISFVSSSTPIPLPAGFFVYGEPVTVGQAPPPTPTVTSVTPTSGSTAGNTTLTITGSNFTGASSITVGSAACASFSVTNATTASCVTPQGSVGAQDIVVTTSAGSGTGSGLFTYVLSSVAGTCGSAGGQAFSYLPSANLCSTGTATAVTSASGQYSWSCNGSGGGANASCTANWASNAGTGAGSLSASGNGWSVTAASFASTPSVTPPSGVTFPNGLLALQLATGTSGSDATVVVQYTTPVPPGAVYMKYGKTQTNQTDHWYELAANRAVFSQDRMSVTLTLTDGGAGDHDLLANGTIVDPGGPALVAAPAAIPTLSEWAMILMASLMGLFAFTRIRRQS